MDKGFGEWLGKQVIQELRIQERREREDIRRLYWEQSERRWLRVVDFFAHLVFILPFDFGILVLKLIGRILDFLFSFVFFCCLLCIVMIIVAIMNDISLFYSDTCFYSNLQIVSNDKIILSQDATQFIGNVIINLCGIAGRNKDFFSKNPSEHLSIFSWGNVTI